MVNRRIPRAYCAGPFRGATRNDVQNNIDAARNVGVQVARMGLFPVVPHLMTGILFEDIQNDQFWLDGTMDELRTCDVVVAVEGWQKSSGARAEIDEARRLGMPLFYAGTSMKNAPPGAGSMLGLTVWLKRWEADHATTA